MLWDPPIDLCGIGVALRKDQNESQEHVREEDRNQVASCVTVGGSVEVLYMSYPPNDVFSPLVVQMRREEYCRMFVLVDIHEQLHDFG